MKLVEGISMVPCERCGEPMLYYRHKRFCKKCRSKNRADQPANYRFKQRVKKYGLENFTSWMQMAIVKQKIN